MPLRSTRSINDSGSPSSRSTSSVCSPSPGGGRRTAPGVARQTHRHAGHAQRAGVVLDLDDHLVVQDLRVGEDLAVLVDRRRRSRRAAESPRGPRSRGQGPEELADRRRRARTRFSTRSLVGATNRSSVSELRLVHGGAQVAEELVVVAGEVHEPVVGAAVGVVRRVPVDRVAGPGLLSARAGSTDRCTAPGCAPGRR